MPKTEKTKLYIDTSIPSAYYDASKPVRQLMTQKWFEKKASSHELYISVTTIEGLNMETYKNGYTENEDNAL